MIAKNEEDVIGRCLACAQQFADEIIVVDTGSNDKTKEIALKYTKLVYDFKWIDDFAAARNFSFSKANCDYIMWLDADDVVLESDIEKIKKLKSTLDESTDMVMMKYHIAFDENGLPTFSYYRERIVLRNKNYSWIGAVHEVISPSGTIIYSDAAITHKKLHRSDPQRNLRIFEKELEKGKTLDPRQLFYYARELYYNERYTDAISFFNQFLSGDGWIENRISACRDLASCYYCIHDDINALQSLFRSFSYDEPRAEVCCDIGKHFFDRQQYNISIFWYLTAASRTLDETSGGFHQRDSYGYIPYLQLCVCYDRLGDYQKAEYYNEQARLIKPNDRTVLNNKQYFDTRKRNDTHKI